MINEGIKNKPLDRYPYMENDLKKSIIIPDMEEDIKKLQRDVQEINEVLSVIGKDVIDLSEIAENLIDNTQYNVFFKLNPDINYIEVIHSKAFRAGNCMQVYLAFKILDIPTSWNIDLGYFDYTIIPRAVNMYAMTDPRFLAKVSTASGLVTCIPVRDEYITAGRSVSLSGSYIIDVEGG